MVGGAGQSCCLWCACVNGLLHTRQVLPMDSGKAKELVEKISINPNNLDDEEENDGELVLPFRDLFWDKLILFLTSAIIALTAVDIFTELLRGGSDVVCYIPEELNVSESQDAFIHGFCSQSVPDTQYLPMFVLIHGILIGAIHYVWKSSFSSHFNYFFSLASRLSRLHDESTGVYPTQNITIIRRLNLEFSSYNRKQVFIWYQLKLIGQFIVSLASVLISFLVFTNFNVEFQCPRSKTDTNIWPYTNTTMNCIYTSLRLFSLVRIVDLLLLCLIIIALIWGLLWTISRHTQELNFNHIASFSFTTGLSGSYFVPKSIFGNIKSLFSGRFWEEIKIRLFIPRISTDFEFFVMLLYRADSSLAHSFTEGQVHLYSKALEQLDHQMIFTHDDITDKGTQEHIGVRGGGGLQPASSPALGGGYYLSTIIVS